MSEQLACIKKTATGQNSMRGLINLIAGKKFLVMHLSVR